MKQICLRRSQTASNLFSLWLSLVFLSLLSGCFGDTVSDELEQARRHEEAHEYRKALETLDRVIRRHRTSEFAIQAARSAAKLSVYNAKDYQGALRYHKFLVLNSPLEKERYESQKKVAEIHFSHLVDYRQAIIEYSRLLEIARSKADEIDFRKYIARSYFFLKNFFQAQVELDHLAEQKLSDKDLYDVLFLKGNISLPTKKTETAIQLFHRLLDEFPERARQDNVAIHLAICYEEKENFSRAIEILDDLKEGSAEPRFIDDKIRRLKLRQSHLPGAKGLRK